MSTQHAVTTPQQFPTTARDLAFSGMLRDSNERANELQAYFEARDAEKEEDRKRREESKSSQFGRLLTDSRGYHRVALATLSRLRNIQVRNPAECSVIWHQIMLGGNALGLDVDVEIEAEHESEGPVFDRTSTGRRQGGGKFGPQGAPVARAAGNKVTRTTVNMRLAEDMLERARAGLPMRHRVGRPSNVERATQAWAEAKLAEEQELRSEHDANLRTIEDAIPAPSRHSDVQGDATN